MIKVLWKFILGIVVVGFCVVGMIGVVFVVVIVFGNIDVCECYF